MCSLGRGIWPSERVGRLVEAWAHDFTFNWQLPRIWRLHGRLASGDRQRRRPNDDASSAQFAARVCCRFGGQDLAHSHVLQVSSALDNLAFELTRLCAGLSFRCSTSPISTRPTHSSSPMPWSTTLLLLRSSYERTWRATGTTVSRPPSSPRLETDLVRFAQFVSASATAATSTGPSTTSPTILSLAHRRSTRT